MPIFTTINVIYFTVRDIIIRIKLYLVNNYFANIYFVRGKSTEDDPTELQTREKSSRRERQSQANINYRKQYTAVRRLMSN